MNINGKAGAEIMLHRKQEILVLKRFERLFHLLINEKAFRKKFGFSLNEYLSNRREFVQTCQYHANHIEKFDKDTGIARTVGGSVSIVSGGAVVLGIILAPFTVGASLGLTIGGITGSILGGGTTFGATLAKGFNKKSDQNKISKALMELDYQEKVVSALLGDFQDTTKKMFEFIESGTFDAVLRQIGEVGFVIGSTGGIVFKGISLGESIFYTIRAIASVSDEVATIAAESAAAPAIISRGFIAAGSVTAKVFSGIFAGVGIGIAAWDIYQGVSDIKGSDTAKKFRKQAEEYDKKTDCLEQFLTGLRLT